MKTCAVPLPQKTPWSINNPFFLLLIAPSPHPAFYKNLPKKNSVLNASPCGILPHRLASVRKRDMQCERGKVCWCEEPCAKGSGDFTDPGDLKGEGKHWEWNKKVTPDKDVPVEGPKKCLSRVSALSSIRRPPNGGLWASRADTCNSRAGLGWGQGWTLDFDSLQGLQRAGDGGFRIRPTWQRLHACQWLGLKAHTPDFSLVSPVCIDQCCPKEMCEPRTSFKTAF